MSTKTDPLLQPFTLRHLTLKNRIMSTPHEPAYAEDGMPHLKSIHINLKQKLNEYWKAHPDEIDALFKK